MRVDTETAVAAQELYEENGSFSAANRAVGWEFSHDVFYRLYHGTLKNPRAINMFRRKVGLDPIVRNDRMSVPKCPVKAARYMEERVSDDWLDTFLAEIARMKG